MYSCETVLNCSLRKGILGPVPGEMRESLQEEMAVVGMDSKGVPARIAIKN